MAINNHLKCILSTHNPSWSWRWHQGQSLNWMLWTGWIRPTRWRGTIGRLKLLQLCLLQCQHIDYILWKYVTWHKNTWDPCQRDGKKKNIFSIVVEKGQFFKILVGLWQNFFIFHFCTIFVIFPSCRKGLPARHTKINFWGKWIDGICFNLKVPIRFTSPTRPIEQKQQ